MEEHISGQKLGGYVRGKEELNELEQGHLRTCDKCSELFHDLLISGEDEPEKPS